MSSSIGWSNSNSFLEIQMNCRSPGKLTSIQYIMPSKDTPIIFSRSEGSRDVSFAW